MMIDRPPPLLGQALQRLLFYALLLVVTDIVVNAYPEGAPNCVLDTASPESIHTGAPTPTRTIRTGGPLSDHGFGLALNGIIVSSGETNSATRPWNITANVDYAVSFVPINISDALIALPPPPESWRGLLLILHQTTGLVDLSAGFMPKPPYQAAAGCGGFLSRESGITHADRSVKNAAQAVATLRIDTTATNTATLYTTNTRLDVNMVIANNATHSIFYYSQYWLAAVSNVTRAPLPPPTTRPTIKPTSKPIFKPTFKPTSKPVVVTSTNRPVVGSTTTKSPTRQPQPVTVSTSPTKAPTRRSFKCGLLGGSLFCPLTRCGFIGRLLGLCQRQ